MNPDETKIVMETIKLLVHINGNWVKGFAGTVLTEAIANLNSLFDDEKPSVEY
jgi:hypothetical protein